MQYGAGVTRNLDCPKEMVGRVIGKGGETIKAMQREFQANIQIDQTSLPMKITISGQPASVERAYGVVAEIVAGGNPYIGGSVGHAGNAHVLVAFCCCLARWFAWLAACSVSSTHCMLLNCTLPVPANGICLDIGTSHFAIVGTRCLAGQLGIISPKSQSSNISQNISLKCP